MEAGDLERAAALLGESVAIWPHFKTLELLGECLLRLDRPREAIGPLAAASALHRQDHAPRGRGRPHEAVNYRREEVSQEVVP